MLFKSGNPWIHLFNGNAKSWHAQLYKTPTIWFYLLIFSQLENEEKELLKFFISHVLPPVNPSHVLTDRIHSTLLLPSMSVLSKDTPFNNNHNVKRWIICLICSVQIACLMCEIIYATDVKFTVGLWSYAASCPPATFAFVLFDSKPVDQVESCSPELDSSHFTQLTLLGKCKIIYPFICSVMCRYYCRQWHK